jgi:hypothetical protein
VTNIDTRAIPDIVGATWCELLEIPTPSEEDDFFGLGGSSLLAVRFIEEIEAKLHISFPIDVLFLEGTYGAILTACVVACAGGDGGSGG